jgi:hypothetical protein
LPAAVLLFALVKASPFHPETLATLYAHLDSREDSPLPRWEVASTTALVEVQSVLPPVVQCLQCYLYRLHGYVKRLGCRYFSFARVVALRAQMRQLYRERRRERTLSAFVESTAVVMAQL